MWRLGRFPRDTEFAFDIDNITNNYSSSSSPRGLCAFDPDKERVQAWPQDIRDHALRLTARVFAIET